MTTMTPEEVARRAWIVRGVFIALVLLAALVIILTSQNDEEPQGPEARSATSYDQEYGGGAGRYEAVLGLTDCSALGRMFSDGKANFEANAVGKRQQWLGQMEVTADRMDALGCP